MLFFLLDPIVIVVNSSGCSSKYFMAAEQFWPLDLCLFVARVSFVLYLSGHKISDLLCSAFVQNRRGRQESTTDQQERDEERPKEPTNLADPTVDTVANINMTSNSFRICVVGGGPAVALLLSQAGM